MDNDVVIVALPPVDDKVYRISSEKVPHLTILYLGQANLSADAVLYVEHACSELSPFYATVDHRGPLGSDSADVLYFEDSSWDLKRVREFRHYLLQNDEIKTAYDAVEQYPQWTPHLTLGYPETPAHEDDSEYSGVHSVRFDRISVWMDDSEGPTFRLKYDESAMEVAMSDLSTAERGAAAVDELFHFGVKGMKWGVRNGDYEGASRAVNKDARKDAQEFARAKMFYGEGAGTRRKLIKAKIETKSKRNPDYKKAFDHHLAKQDLGKHADKARSERRRKNAKNSTAKTVRGVNRELNGPFGPSVTSKVITEGLKLMTHSEAESNVLRGEEAVDELFHYGKKGMKWGVRNDPGHEGEKVKTKKLDKLDQKWEKTIYSTSGAIKVHNAMADHFNSRVGALNDKHPDADYRKGEDTPEWRAYMDDINTLQSQSYAHAVKSVHGSSPSGKKKAEYLVDENGDERIVVHSAHLAHAEAEEVTEADLILLAKTDEQGRIIELNQAEAAEVEHDALGEEFFAHYGVKGMKWGVTTKDKATKTTPTDVQVSQKKPGTFAKAKGGEKHPLNDDALKSLAVRQKAKASTTDSLSNVELRAAVERMQLEQRYKQLEFQSDRRGKGSRFAAGLFGKKRYNGKDLKFEDEQEAAGERARKTAKLIAEALAAKNA